MTEERDLTERMFEQSTPVATQHVPDLMLDGEGTYHMRSSCWQRSSNGSYLVSGPTQDSLPAGVYKMDMTNDGIPIFRPSAFNTDDVFDIETDYQRRVLDRVARFWTSEPQYRKFGLLYKTGIFLYGPPGCGKSTLIKLVVNKLTREQDGVTVVGTSMNPQGAARCLSSFRKIEPARKLLVLFEDLEEYVENYKDASVLSLLDGEDQLDNVIYVATSNLPQKLGARFLNRPSRFDEIIEVGMPNETARRKYLEHIFPQYDPKWIEATEGLGLAHLRELVSAVCCLGMDATETIARLKGQKKIPHVKETNMDSFGFTSKKDLK